MSLGEVIILSLIQGLTEFLPVSSSGHLLAARFLFGWVDTSGTAFDAFLHLGTLLSVILFYWRVWVGIARSFFVNDEAAKDKRQLFFKLVFATLPGAAVGYFWQDHIEYYFSSLTAVAIGFIITALSLVAIEALAFVSTNSGKPKHANFLDALFIGISQIAALIPSISRSGITIAAGVSRGLSRAQATNFSFLMSAPIIAGAGLMGLSSLANSGHIPPAYLLLGFTISFLFGLLAIYSLLKIIKSSSLWPFVVYLLFLSLLLLIHG